MPKLEGFEVEVKPVAQQGGGRRGKAAWWMLTVACNWRCFSMLDDGRVHDEDGDQKQGRFREIKAAGGWRSARTMQSLITSK